jgi:hypothetical protein
VSNSLTTVIDPLIEAPLDKVVSYIYDALNRSSLSEYLTDATTENIVYDNYGNRY